MRRSFRSRLDSIRSNITWPRVGAAVLVLLAALVIRAAYLLIFKGYVWLEGTGFGGKTLWDWLELLIIPAVLGVGALWFNKATRDREQATAEDQRREEALQNYLDKMAELLLEKELLKKKDNPDDPVVDVAQIRTVTTLRILDRDRKNILFQFLRDANLADFILVKASLANADLSETRIYDINLSGANLIRADLSGANLNGANLNGTNLRGANLSEASLRRVNLNGTDLHGASLRRANLTGANLRGANLRLANLSGADLRGANLSGAKLRLTNLSGADLTEADLSGADLIGANLSDANLRWADLSGAELTDANLRGAKYNSQTKWPEGFDYENSGAILDE